MACDEAAIKPALKDVVSKMEQCPKYNDLKIALKELASLLPDSNLRNASAENVNVHQNVAPAPQNAVPVPEFKKETSEQKVKSSDPNINVRWNYARLMREIDKVLNSPKSSDDMKTKYRNLKPQFENATKFEEVEKLVNVNNVTFYANSIYSGGTRKRRMRRVKTQRRRKNARTIKKKKITNNKSGKRN
uniref:Uncharacterized protein n=1 Tax=viral metagenome TaxID=1070528 RepID=A0A6C0M032_9ZZZZ